MCSWLSDHTEGIDIAIGATALGAKIIEKHVKLEMILHQWTQNLQ